MIFPDMRIQEMYRKAIDARDAEKIAELIRTEVLPNKANMCAMKEAIQKTPFKQQDGKENPFWLVYFSLLDKNYHP